MAIRKISLKCIIDAFRYIEYANGVELVIPDDYSNLQNDTIELARSLGHIVYTNKTTHALTVNINYQLDDLYITKIEEVEPTTQRCILIDDPEHIYITQDYIPTHNAYCGVGITAYYHSPVVIIVPISKLMNQWKQSFLSFTTLFSLYGIETSIPIKISLDPITTSPFLVWKDRSFRIITGDPEDPGKHGTSIKPILPPLKSTAG